MPHNSLLILIHPPRNSVATLGNIEDNRWHEPAAVFLFHSLINIAVPSLDNISEKALQFIADTIVDSIQLHYKLKKKGKFCHCDVKYEPEDRSRFSGYDMSSNCQIHDVLK